MPYDFYCTSLKAKVKNRVCKQCGIYYPSIAARKGHREDGCGLEVLGNKESISSYILGIMMKKKISVIKKKKTLRF